MIGLAILLLVQTPSLSPGPGGVARVALAAVEADTVARLELAWSGRRDSLAQFGLGMLALYTYRFAKAETHLHAARRRAAPASSLGAWARLGLAGVASTRGQVARADSLYADAARYAREASDANAEWEALLAWAPVRFRQFGSPTALDLLASADSLADGSSREPRFRARCTRAMVGNFVVNEVYHTADSAARSGNLRLAARCLFAAGYRITQQGYADSASAWLRRAADWQRAVRDRSGLAATLQTAGYNELNRSRFAESRLLYETAIQTGRVSGNGSAVLWATLGLSSLFLALDDLEGAAVFGQRADSLATAAGDRQAQAMVRGTLAYRAKALASPNAPVAAMRFREATEPVGGSIHSNALRLLAELAVVQGRFAVATSYLDTAATWAERANLAGDLLSIRVDRARLALRTGDLPTALRLYREELDRRTGSIGRRLESQTGYAVALLRSGETARGTALLLAVADSTDYWRQTLTDDQLRRAVFDLRDFLVRTPPLAQAVVELAAQGSLEVALQLAERRRARTLLDQLTVARGTLGDGSPATALRRGKVPTTAELLRLPDPRLAVLEYVLLPDQRGVVLVVTRDGVRAAGVPPGDSVSALVGRFRALIESGSDAAALGRTIARLVLDPALALLPADVERIVVVPDGALHALPFDALRLDGGVAAGDRHLYSTAPSLAIVGRLWSSRAGAGATQILALGDPAFATPVRDDPAAAWHIAFATVAGLPRLPASGAEARALSGAGLPASVRLRGDASESFLVAEDLTSYRLIHLATHAFVDQRSVARTALALAPGAGQDGFLTVAELSALRLDADLLTLSSCRTGQGVVAGSEGLQGLVSAAFEAGARAVLASRWTVGDRAAAEFTTRFYREVARGVTLDEALAATKRGLARAGRPAREWAAFELWGNGMARLPLRAAEPPTR